MKKYLSFVLACLMVLSSVAFAAPVAVGTVETAKETTVDVTEVFNADMMEETETDTETVTTDLVEEKLVYSINFDNLSAGAFSSQKLAASNYTSQFPTLTFAVSGVTATVEAKTEGSTDMILKGDTSGSSSSHSRWMLTGSAELPNGTYRIQQDIKVDVESQGFTAAICASNTNNIVKGDTITASDSFSTQEKSYVYESGVTSTSYIHNGFVTYENNAKNVWYVDNINIYYTPESCTVTFSGKGAVPAAIGVVKNGYFVPSEYEPKYLPETASEFLGWSLTENGEILTEPVVISTDTTLYAKYSTKEIATTSQYGKLAYFVDFDVAAKTISNSTDLAISEHSVYSAPAISGMPSAKLKAYNNYKTDGDSLITNQNWPRFWFVAYDENDAMTTYPEGVYTIEYVAKADAALGNSVVVNDSSFSGAPVYQANSAFGTEFKEYSASFIYKGRQVSKLNGTVTQTFTEANKGLCGIGLYSGHGADKASVKRYYKWVKIWYTPLKSNVTFDTNGMDVEGLGTKEIGANFKPSDYVLPDCGAHRFAGWALTKEGDYAITDETVVSDGTTLYAVWDENYYAPEGEDLNAGELLAHIHFNNVTASANLNSQMNNYGTIGTAWKAAGSYTYPSIIISNSSNNSNMTSYPANIWLNCNNSVDKFKYNSTNNINQKHPDNEIIISNSKTPAATTFFPKLSIHNNGFGAFADGIYTFAADVYVPENDNIESVKYDAYAKDAKVESATVVATAIPTGERVYIKDSIAIINGSAYDYDTMVENSNNLTENKVTAVGLNFTVKLKEAVNNCPVIHADNFRIYYKPYDYSPKSYSENSIRVNSYSGIRFKASVSDVERANENLTEYGFIVTLKDLLGDTDVKDFTHETNVTKVEGKSYSKAENIDKIYQKDGNITFFTAVLHNIPETQYARDVVVRPYTFVNGEYVYGDAMVNNIKAVAEKLQQDPEKYVGDVKIAVDKILANEKL